MLWCSRAHDTFTELAGRRWVVRAVVGGSGSDAFALARARRVRTRVPADRPQCVHHQRHGGGGVRCLCDGRSARRLSGITAFLVERGCGFSIGQYGRQAGIVRASLRAPREECRVPRANVLANRRGLRRARYLKRAHRIGSQRSGSRRVRSITPSPNEERNSSANVSPTLGLQFQRAPRPRARCRGCSLQRRAAAPARPPAAAARCKLCARTAPSTFTLLRWLFGG